MKDDHGRRIGQSKSESLFKTQQKIERMQVWIKWESACLPNTRPKVQTIVFQKKMVESNNDRCYNINLKKLCYWN
jgi:hypothetical protein